MRYRYININDSFKSRRIRYKSNLTPRLAGPYYAFKELYRYHLLIFVNADLDKNYVN